MFKIQFRKKKRHPDAYQGQYNGQYADNDPFYGYGQEQSFDHYSPEPEYLQDLPTCIFCDGLVAGSHLAITTKSGDHCMHPSCLVSGFALLVNGFGLLMSLFKNNKKGGG